MRIRLEGHAETAVLRAWSHVVKARKEVERAEYSVSLLAEALGGEGAVLTLESGEVWLEAASPENESEVD